MDFALSAEEQAFADEVERFLDENHDPEVMDPTKENFAQLVDTPKRRAFMKKLSARGWLGMTWPKEYGGQEKKGVYEYILNEALARRHAPRPRHLRVRARRRRADRAGRAQRLGRRQRDLRAGRRGRRLHDHLVRRRHDAHRPRARHRRRDLHGTG